MALSCPTTIPVEFSTLEISSGTAIPYYQSIKRSKLPARTTKPLFDRASGLRLVVAIKKTGGVFLQGLTGRQTSRLPPPCLAGCHGSACILPRLAACLLLIEACMGTRHNCVLKYFQLLCTSQQSVGLSKKCNPSLQGGNTRRVKCCLLTRTLDDCLTGFSGKEHKLSLSMCTLLNLQHVLVFHLQCCNSSKEKGTLGLSQDR